MDKASDDRVMIVTFGKGAQQDWLKLLIETAAVQDPHVTIEIVDEKKSRDSLSSGVIFFPTQLRGK